MADFLPLAMGHMIQIAGGFLLVYLYYKEKIHLLHKNKLVFILGIFLIFFGLFRMILIYEALSKKSAPPRKEISETISVPNKMATMEISFAALIAAEG